MLYATSLSDNCWEIIMPFLIDHGIDTKRKRTHQIRSIVDACFYIVDNGTKWRNLPNDFPPWKTVYDCFRRWSESGLWEKISYAVVEMTRLTQGKEATPSLCSVDSQSQTAEPGIEARGLDGGKKVNGRKRHIAVDTNGLILSCRVTAANVSDVHGGNQLAEYLNNKESFPRLKKILGDSAYRGVGEDLDIAVSVEASQRREGKKGFVPEAFRWAVERTFAWLNRQRRVARNYEKKTLHQESMNYIANIRICLKKIKKRLSSSEKF